MHSIAKQKYNIKHSKNKYSFSLTKPAAEPEEGVPGYSSFPLQTLKEYKAFLSDHITESFRYFQWPLPTLSIIKFKSQLWLFAVTYKAFEKNI